MRAARIQDDLPSRDGLVGLCLYVADKGNSTQGHYQLHETTSNDVDNPV